MSGVADWAEGRRRAELTVTPPPLASPEEVAAYLGLALVTLAKWRQRGKGPKWIKAGSSVRYEWAEVRRWVEGGGDR